MLARYELESAVIIIMMMMMMMIITIIVIIIIMIIIVLMSECWSQVFAGSGAGQEAGGHLPALLRAAVQPVPL